MRINIAAKTQQIAASITHAKLASANLKPVFQSFGQYYVKRIRAGFDRSIGPYGESWEPLSMKTILAKRKKGQTSKPLIATGLSRRSIRFDSRPSRCYFIFVTDYLWFHDRGNRKLPKRQVFPDEENGLDDVSEAVLMKLTIQYLRKSWARF